jgi:dolichol-phosphate mannosyltransferase
VAGAIAGALYYCRDVLVVDDGSIDGTADLLAARDDIRVIRHPTNQGYGTALRSAFDFAVAGGYDVLATIDCDGQHQPQLIPTFVERCWNGEVDIVSGSRYLRRFPGDSDPPEERRRINRLITEELNRRLGLNLTDAFCGFKAYRVSALVRIELTEPGYAMPLELWAHAARLGLRIVELPVPLIYLDQQRSFGGALDDAETRLAAYRQVLERAGKRDSVVEEVRQIRDAYARQFGYDLKAIHRDLKAKEQASGRQVVSFPPRRPKPPDPTSPHNP